MVDERQLAAMAAKAIVHMAAGEHDQAIDVLDAELALLERDEELAVQNPAALATLLSHVQSYRGMHRPPECRRRALELLARCGAVAGRIADDEEPA